MCVQETMPARRYTIYRYTGFFNHMSLDLFLTFGKSIMTEVASGQETEVFACRRWCQALPPSALPFLIAYLRSLVPRRNAAGTDEHQRRLQRRRALRRRSQPSLPPSLAPSRQLTARLPSRSTRRRRSRGGGRESEF